MISIADLHLSDSRPSCRTDNYIETEFNKLDFLCRCAKEDDGILTVSGDFFDVPKPSLSLVRKTIKKLNEYKIKIYATCGQHDLPNHSIKDVKHSGLGVLAASGVIELILDPEEPIKLKDDIFLYGCPFGLKPIQPNMDNFNVLLWHEMIINRTLWSGQKALSSNVALRKFKYDIIISGDNHSYFIEEYKSRILINPGSVVRKTIKQIKHRPIAFWTNFSDYETISIPIEKDVFDLSLLDKEGSKEFDDSFVTLLDSKAEIELSFKENLNNYLVANNIKDKTIDKVREFTINVE
jgi:hypothetical protein